MRIRRWLHVCRAASKIAAGLAPLLLAGCATGGFQQDLPRTVTSRDKAAAVLVAPTMVAPWSDVSAALKPNFRMTGDIAVPLVLPITEGIQQSQLNASSFALGLGLPQSSTAPSNVPTVPTGTPAGGALPATGAAAALALDPVLKYKSAYYLNQTVQLLNQEIDNVARRRCFVPYVVRLKLAVMPYRPALGYSAHAHIAFLSGEHGSGLPPTPSPLLARECRETVQAWAGKSEDRQAQDVLRAAAAERREITDPGSDAKDARTVKYKTQLPIVVPLLAADDLDVAMRSQSSEAARQLGFALNFMVHGIGGSAGANAVKQQLKTLANQDLSSALTISRDNDNTLYVEIAAANAASGLPALVGQTYDVAVLLLIPRSYFGGIDPRSDLKPAKIGFVTSTDFRDVTTGTVLPASDLIDVLDRFNNALRPYADDEIRGKWQSLDDRIKFRLMSEAIELLQQGRYEDFVNTYFFKHSDSKIPDEEECKVVGDFAKDSYKCFPINAAPALWASLVVINDDSPNKYGLFEAPIPSQITIPAQTVVLSDDGTNPIHAELGNVRAQSVANLSATLKFIPGKVVDEPACATRNKALIARATQADAKLGAAGKAANALANVQLTACPQHQEPAQKPMILPMTVGALNPAEHTLELTMPSLAKLDIKAFYAPPSDVWRGAPALKRSTHSRHLSEVAKLDAEPLAGTTTGAATITFATDGCDLTRDVCATLAPDPETALPSAANRARMDAQLYVIRPAVSTAPNAQAVNNLGKAATP